MRILFAGGGTAGHVNPAVAIAEALQKRHRDLECAFVGREGGDENRSVLNQGYKLYTVRMQGLSRKLALKNLKSIYLAARSLGETKRIIGDFRPDAIVATGGYVSWPVLKTGIRLGIPTAIHESNIYPGLVTRMLGKRCSVTLLNSSESMRFLEKKENVSVVGNPLRNDFFTVSRAAAREKLGLSGGEFFIVSFGGSLGSEKINRSVISLMNAYSSKVPRVRHLHSAGGRYFGEIKEKHAELVEGKNGCEVRAYIDNMPTVLTAADLVISRSGAMTLTEISRVGVPAILIPSPNVADDHQLKNANALAEQGAAVVIEENELSERLEETVRELYLSNERRILLGQKARELYRPDAAIKICREIERIVDESRRSAEH